MLLSNQTVVVNNFWEVLGFCTGSRNVFPFSVDLSNFCRSFRVKSDSAIKKHKGHDFFFINEMHHVIKRNRLREIITTIGNKIIFWAQSRMSGKFCRVIRRVFRFIVAVHRLTEKEKNTRFRQMLRAEFRLLAGIVEKLEQRLGTLVAGRSKLLLLRALFEY